MKTILKIKQDYNGDLSYQYFTDEINYLVNQIDIYCEIKNNNFLNIVCQEKNYNSSKDQYKNKTIVDATGYSQGDWQTYVLHHNLKETNKDLICLCNELKKSFTQFNDYTAQIIKRTEIAGILYESETIDNFSFSIRDIEFPDKKNILETYNDIYGINYDNYEIYVT